MVHHFYLFLSFQLARSNSLLNISCRGLATHLNNAVSHNRLSAKKYPVLCSLTFYFLVLVGEAELLLNQVTLYPPEISPMCNKSTPTICCSSPLPLTILQFSQVLHKHQVSLGIQKLGNRGRDSLSYQSEPDLSPGFGHDSSSVLSSFLGLPNQLLSLLASNNRSDACSTKINMCFLQKNNSTD